MRVLRVLNELRPSGVEANLRATARLWPTYDIDLEVLSVGQTIGPFAPDLIAAGYRLHHIPMTPFPRFLSRYLKLLRSQRYDVVHIHPERANFYTSAAARLAGAPVVRSVHNGFTFEGLLRAQRLVQRALLRSIGTTFVSVGASVQDIEWRHFRNSTERIFNSYDEERFSPVDVDGRRNAREKLGLRHEDYVIVSIGNCSTVKNHTAILDALTRIDGTVPYHYVHVGIEDAEHSERRQAEAVGLDDRITFLGQRDDVPTILRAADCHVMPSLYEGFSNAALEALGCGVPSVLADVQGLKDLKAFFPSIWWVSPSGESIAAALLEVAALGESEAERVRAELAGIARTDFRLERAVADYAQLYRQVCRA